MPLERFKDRVAIVTGAASGIGKATVERLAGEGASVVAIDVNKAALEAAANDANEGAKAAGGTVVARVADVSKEEDTGATVATAVEQFGRLDVLANIAGIMQTCHTERCPLDLWQRILDVNLTGTFLMCRAALPHLVETTGNIVNTSSTSAAFAHPWMAAYAASKGGVASLTQTIAIEYAKRGVRANTISPGSIKTGITENITFPEDADRKLLYRIMSPTGPRGPETVASVIAMLASDDGAHLTGVDIRIDGGTHA